MNNEIISSKRAPQAVGPYSQGVIVNNMIFLSGQLPINPVDDKLEKGDIKEQTELVLNNIKNILEDYGSSLNNVIKVMVFMTDMNEFSEMNEVYAHFFKEKCPARSTVEVSSLFNGLKIEIEAIALLD